jgi:hypothetical protein
MNPVKVGNLASKLAHLAKRAHDSPLWFSCSGGWYRFGKYLDELEKSTNRGEKIGKRISETYSRVNYPQEGESFDNHEILRDVSVTMHTPLVHLLQTLDYLIRVHRRVESVELEKIAKKYKIPVANVRVSSVTSDDSDSPIETQTELSIDAPKSLGDSFSRLCRLNILITNSLLRPIIHHGNKFSDYLRSLFIRRFPVDEGISQALSNIIKSFNKGELREFNISEKLLTNSRDQELLVDEKIWSKLFKYSYLFFDPEAICNKLFLPFAEDSELPSNDNPKIY